MDYTLDLVFTIAGGPHRHAVCVRDCDEVDDDVKLLAEAYMFKWLAAKLNAVPAQ